MICALARKFRPCRPSRGFATYSCVPSRKALVQGELRMCGIVGYTGSRQAEPILLDGLARLEYRGYDSAGIATLTGEELCVRKSAGRIAELSQLLQTQHAPGTTGISHTRWATHGGATD